MLRGRGIAWRMLVLGFFFNLKIFLSCSLAFQITIQRFMILPGENDSFYYKYLLINIDYYYSYKKKFTKLRDDYSSSYFSNH